jgi:hypothetical protein
VEAAKAPKKEAQVAGLFRDQGKGDKMSRPALPLPRHGVAGEEIFLETWVKSR